jgi:hypothetical protein
VVLNGNQVTGCVQHCCGVKSDREYKMVLIECTRNKYFLRKTKTFDLNLIPGILEKS